MARSGSVRHGVNDTSPRIEMSDSKRSNDDESLHSFEPSIRKYKTSSVLQPKKKTTGISHASSEGRKYSTRDFINNFFWGPSGNDPDGVPSTSSTTESERSHARPRAVTFEDVTPTEAEYLEMYKKFNRRCNPWLCLTVVSTVITEIAIFFLITPLRFGEFINMMLKAIDIKHESIPSMNCLHTVALFKDLTDVEQSFLNSTLYKGGSPNYNLRKMSSECIRYNLVLDMFSVEYGGYLTGAALSGVLGDIYGRRKVALVAFGVWSILLFTLCFTASLIALKVIYFTACSVGMIMAFMLYINLMEVAPPKLRCLVMYLLHMYYLAAVLAELVFRYCNMSWRNYQYCNVAFLPVILFTLWYTPESPYWMWNKNQKRKAFAVLYEMTPSEASKYGMCNETNASYDRFFPVLATMMATVFCNKYKRKPFWLFMIISTAGSSIYSISIWSSHFLELYSENFRSILSLSVGAGGLLTIPVFCIFNKKWGQVCIYVMSAFAALGILALPVESMRVAYLMFQTMVSFCSIQLIWYMMIDYFPTCIRATAIAFSVQIHFLIQLIIINTVFHWMQKVAREALYAAQFCAALAGIVIVFMPDTQNFLPNQKLDYV